MKIDQVLIRPILTEKATNLAKDNVYLFAVNLNSNSFQIKNAIQKLYKVKVASIHILIRKGKKRKVGRRSKIKQLKDVKMAFIKLKEGKIDLFPQT